ncbi:bifunctional [glutamate--ammonia ligase]-adenylyl-L-tyrosine phosphorylase/[glutamate--ammonia-ligase] adenylyltransferase, partial [Marinospirillum sp.]|uniref:bifunctional [glutamate--ammonia ligase]-adenylyl-L-tyrosine phosphorylase/[glutamate--ammonia-ligase] adenylyltransferase n=1 Tax=Marinospirillum sp. TaxID=2183934 RepID=UPI003A88B3D5
MVFQQADLHAFPRELQPLAQEQRMRLTDALERADHLAQMQQRPLPSTAYQKLSASQQQAWWRCLITSDAALTLMERDVHRVLQLSEAELKRPYQRQDYQHWLAELIEQEAKGGIQDEPNLHRLLRRFRAMALLRLLWRDANLISPPDAAARHAVWQTAAEMSHLASVCVEAALSWLEDHYAPAWGRPYPRETQLEQVQSGAVAPLRLVVLGMGKLGAGELNLSSDIDLIFAFAEGGETLGGRRSFDHQEYFTRLGQKLIAALDQSTADGQVFRVDMRLRPYGDAGALALSFNALLEYYQDQGRDWERYAMIKAAVLAGDQQAGAELLARLNPFVYRRYVDFSAIESLRAMKAMINREVKRKGLEQNIKLGRGGIREIEFITQVFQLIRGGRDRELQETSIRRVVPLLADLGLLPQPVTQELLMDYAQLRDLEHALQGLADRQTQDLPQDPLTQARIALRCGDADWEALIQRLDALRERVRQHFDAVIADPDEAPEEEEEGLASLWPAECETAAAEAILAEQGFTDPAASWQRIQGFYFSRAVANMQAIGRQRLDALMPQWLLAVSETDAPDLALERSLWLIEAVLRRTAYLLLLTENPQALKQLVGLCATSAWMAEQLAKMPILLDELLTPATLYSPADKARLRDELRQHLCRIPEEDTESLMEAVRYFRHANVLRVAASDLVAQRPLMKVSDYLTFIAEVLLEQVLHFVWRDLTQRYGHPLLDTGEVAQTGFIVLGYGKLGGIELGYGSDLDLVFLHQGHPVQGTTGEKSLDSSTFYSRLGQKMIHWLTALTPSGQLYEVDMRLRPSGNAGLLVSSLKAFGEYQRKEAWTWEHQALVRARVVAGDPALAARFEAERAAILSQRRDLDQLKQQVLEMRDKMRRHLGGKTDTAFHLKQDAGGIVDIEFIVQYAVLAYSCDHPRLLTYTDNMRILDELAATGLLPAETVHGLQQAYLAYRQATHQAALRKTSSLVEAAPWQAQRELVIQVWHQ